MCDRCIHFLERFLSSLLPLLPLKGIEMKEPIKYKM